MASLLRLLKEDLRRKRRTADALRIEDTLKDIEENPGNFAAASSLSDERTWLHFAAQQGAEEAVRKLLEHGSDVHARDLLNRTAVHHAAFTRSEGGAKCIELLLRYGADANPVDCMGYTPLHYAVQQENVFAIKILGMTRTNFNAVGPSGYTPLHIACQSDSALEVIKLLVQNGANVHAYDETHRSPADVARDCGAFKAMKTLHEAQRQWENVQYLYADEAKAVGQDIAARRLSLKSGLGQVLRAVADASFVPSETEADPEEDPDGATARSAIKKPLPTGRRRRRAKQTEPTDNSLVDADMVRAAPKPRSRRAADPDDPQSDSDG